MANAHRALDADLHHELEVLRLLGVHGAFLTLEKLSEFLGGRPSVMTLYKWAKTGKIPCRNHGGFIVAYIPDILAWSASRKIQDATPKRGASVSKFKEVRNRLRSLKTEVTALPTHAHQERG